MIKKLKQINTQLEGDEETTRRRICRSACAIKKQKHLNTSPLITISIFPRSFLTATRRWRFYFTHYSGAPAGQCCLSCISTAHLSCISEVWLIFVQLNRATESNLNENVEHMAGWLVGWLGFWPNSDDGDSLKSRRDSARIYKTEYSSDEGQWSSDGWIKRDTARDDYVREERIRRRCFRWNLISFRLWFFT